MCRWSRTSLCVRGPLLISAVGMAGQVYSFESNPSHMHAAVRNYEQWRANWALTCAPWPDNVQFIDADLSAVGDHIDAPVDAVSTM